VADLVIAGVTIIQDESARYNLNALHQASEQAKNRAKSPGEWVRRKSTQALIAELEASNVNLRHQALAGDATGTYAHELLAVEYAGWISPAFRLKVNQAFIDLRTGRLAPSASPVDKYPELRAIQDLLIATAEARQHADLARQEASKAMEVAHLALRGQHWLTIRQYVYLHDLQAQMPPSRQRAYATFLLGFCQEKNIPVYSSRAADRGWGEENTYSLLALSDTLPGWLRRFGNQLSLEE
jgi:hypothetical protein